MKNIVDKESYINKCVNIHKIWYQFSKTEHVKEFENDEFKKLVDIRDYKFISLFLSSDAIYIENGQEVDKVLKLMTGEIDNLWIDPDRIPAEAGNQEDRLCYVIGDTNDEFNKEASRLADLDLTEYKLRRQDITTLSKMIDNFKEDKIVLVEDLLKFEDVFNNALQVSYDNRVARYKLQKALEEEMVEKDILNAFEK